MFYLHVSPPSTSTAPAVATATATKAGTPRPHTPVRPKSASPAICVPTIPPVAAKANVGSTIASPRVATYVGFSPRVPSAPRLGSAIRMMPYTGSDFQHILQAQSPVVAERTASSLFTSPQAGSSPSATTPRTINGSSATSAVTGNVYHAMTARKSAEETAKQLARRIAHLRAQEEKVLHEVQQMKHRLEVLLETQGDAGKQSIGRGGSRGDGSVAKTLAVRRPVSATTACRQAQRNELKTPRSSEQLQFLTKQRRVIQNRKVESAREQKEKRQMALDLHRQKDAAEQNRRAALKDRIRQERQRAIDIRAAQQHQRLDELEQQHHARLRQEQMREMEAQKRIEAMRDEEQNIALRLQALQLHQDHIKRGLQDTLHGGPQAPRSSPLRPASAKATTSSRSRIPADPNTQ